MFFHLDKLLERGQEGFPEEQARTILAEVSMGLVHLHSRGFVHLDMKIENVMLDETGHVKIVDFGLSVEVTADLDGDAGFIVKMAGSLMSMSPELVQKKLVGRFTDWWAVGVLAHDLLTGHTPWSTMSDEEQIRKDIMSLEVLPPRDVSREAGEFVVSLLRKDRRVRLGTRSDDDVLASPFFCGIDWKAMERREMTPAFVPSKGVAYVSAADASGALSAYRRSIAHSEGAANDVDLGLLRAATAPPCAGIRI
jgi:serine/threonine protein kinase